MAKKFEELKVWQEWRSFYKEISSIFDIKFKDSFFKDQILRATLSITNNIAEWFERETKKELIRFLYIARWSAWEVRSMLHISKDKWYIDEEKFTSLYNTCSYISIMLYKLIKHNIKVDE